MASTIRRDLVRMLSGENAHASFEASLEGLPPRQRHVRPKPELHSVWELVEHLRIAQEDIHRYMVDPEWVSPAWPSAYWPDSSLALTARRWNGSVRGFLADRARVIALVRNPRIELTAEIPHAGVSYLREILLIADHNAYHVGQIILVRKLLGAWR